MIVYHRVGEKMKEIIIGKNDDDQRLDRFLKKYLGRAPKSVVQKYIRKHKFRLNGVHPKADTFIYEGDVLAIYISDTELDRFTKKTQHKKRVTQHLKIVYEDDQLIVIDKPKGILSHAVDSTDYGKNIVDIMVDYLIDKGDFQPRIEHNFRPALANRLDRNTSGLLIGCKTSLALKETNEALREDRVEKYYNALVLGKIEQEHRIDKKLSKNESRNIVSIDGNEGKESITEIFPVHSSSTFTEIAIKLITGRTHQIRVHLASIGHPIAGDRKYGNQKINRQLYDQYGLESQLLHANRLVLQGYETLTYLNGLEIRSKDSSYEELIKRIFMNERG